METIKIIARHKFLDQRRQRLIADSMDSDEYTRKRIACQLALTLHHMSALEFMLIDRADSDNTACDYMDKYFKLD